MAHPGPNGGGANRTHITLFGPATRGLADRGVPEMPEGADAPPDGRTDRMLTDLFNWWKEQMRDLVPASLRPSSGRTWRRTLVIVPDTPDLSSVELFLQSRGGETSLGRHG